MTATTLPDAVAATGAGETEAQFKTFVQNVRAALAEMGDPMGTFGVTQNLSLTAAVAGNALTIAVKDRAGADPTATAPSSPVSVPFRNATVATGDFSVLNVTAASSLVISSGSTMGARNGIPFRLWIVAFNDAGTWRIGAINCVTTVDAAGTGTGSDVTKIYPLSAWGIASSTAEGGAGAADNAQVFYTGTAVTSKGFVVLGYMSWESGLTTAGTWDAGPTRIQLFGAGVPLPGQIVQVQRTDTGATATGTTTIPYDDTIPQNTEGDQYLSQAITPLSASNVLEVDAQAFFTSNLALGNYLMSALFQDSVADALKATNQVMIAAQAQQQHNLRERMLAATSSATTFKVRAGGQSAGTFAINGETSGRKMGGVLNSFIEVREVMG